MHGLRIQQGWSISCSDPNIIGWTELWGGRLLPWWVVESLNPVIWCKIRGTTDDVDSTLQVACPLCSCWSWLGKVGTFSRLVLTVTLGLDNSLIKLVMRSGTRQAVLQGRENWFHRVKTESYKYKCMTLREVALLPSAIILSPNHHKSYTIQAPSQRLALS